MKLVSTTLAGPGTETIIGDALRSVAGIVDSALVIYTEPAGPGYWDLDEACGLSFLGPKPWGPELAGRLLLRVWRWEGDFGAARNASLSYAAGYGATLSTTWSIMLDTDERTVCPDPAALRTWLEALPPHVEVALAHSADGSHTRERFFRLPASHRFKGRTHEAFSATIHEQAIIPRDLILWTELPKNEEQLRAKFERDILMLRADIDDDPQDGRAWFYLGTTLQALERYQEAIDALREFHKLDTWEGGAWGCYRAAECYLALGQPDRAIDAALAGMARDAGIAELPWIAAVASLQVGRLEQARCWAELAKTHGFGSEAERRRVGFRLPRGLTMGPDEVLEAVRAGSAK